jgi:hypothetical protein
LCWPVPQHRGHRAGLASLALFYCDFREDQRKDLRSLLSSLLVRLCLQTDSYSGIVSKFYSNHAKGSRHPSDGAPAGCSKDLLKLHGLAPVYLIVDALDECPNTSTVRPPRAKVLNLINVLIGSRLVMHTRRFGICDSNLLICVTNRLEPDIKDILDPSIFRFLARRAWAKVRHRRIHQVEVARLLIEHGAEVATQNKDALLRYTR